MRKRSMLLLTGAVALVASLIVGPAATAKSERQSARTVIIGHDQEPVTLNYITEGNAYTTSLAMNPVLASASVYNQNAKLVPFLVDAAPKIVKSNPLTVTFSYKKTAKWSDGRQVTGADFWPPTGRT